MRLDLEMSLVKLNIQTRESERPTDDLREVKGFLARLSDVMEDSKVNTFFDDYFSTMDDVKATIMIMKTYSILRDRFITLNSREPSKEEMISIMKTAISDKDFRLAMVTEAEKFITGDSLPVIPKLN
jgi:hypothetical protein